MGLHSQLFFLLFFLFLSTWLEHLSQCLHLHADLQRFALVVNFSFGQTPRAKYVYICFPPSSLCPDHLCVLQPSDPAAKRLCEDSMERSKLCGTCHATTRGTQAYEKEGTILPPDTAGLEVKHGQRRLKTKNVHGLTGRCFLRTIHC